METPAWTTAVVGGLLLCCLLSAIAVRRRRGQSYLPGPGGGFLQPNRTGYGNAQPQAAGFGNTNHQYNQQQPEWNNNTATAGGVGTYQPPAGPPPAYHGKETYVGQGQNGGAPQPGGFAPPPGPPSAAHVNDNSVRFDMLHTSIC
ncbi:hypothetical protein PHLCEN_2v5993 [Hermanssonia centrifuga]|uniref:Uncharacterized protein n=1 Tax=Hermanssonia centrifuga TaxID=98765 RepID=A0A2R6P0J1_9APHY|nr:hypothetical protein PHLCEN_2v5993 [Hermanssonia centrifuga]